MIQWKAVLEFIEDRMRVDSPHLVFLFGMKSRQSASVIAYVVHRIKEASR
jgi:hypothetical protein